MLSVFGIGLWRKGNPGICSNTGLQASGVLANMIVYRQGQPLVVLKENNVLSPEVVTCPDYLLQKARNCPPVKTAIVGTGARVVLESVRASVDAGIIDPVLIGEPGILAQIGDEIGFDINHHEIISTPDEKAMGEAGASLARANEVHMVMKGHIHTDNFMRPLISRRTGPRCRRRLSHVFHMTVLGSDRVLMITDGAVNVAPDVRARISIIQNAVDLSHALGNGRPKVALLAASEEISSAMSVTVDCQEITKRCADLEMAADVYGPLAFDNVVSEKAARLKGISHVVAGAADIIVVPTIEAGNALFKMMVYFMGACAAGIVLGADVPILLTSRADPPAARLASAALGAVVASKAA
ncbi:MAG TPA: bifunctional enoyl-CoA hydratase/phosphate acetyltransferase [Gammaproteobacteria bacterium]|jgi:phosphate acetyltransferase|nr:MAG: phosphate acetyltransferase [Gammaproteobacteria bacterium]HBK74892.1 phosphate acetyltransferase [Gammaproteobacteria bacterium]HIM87162.1 bifunctional enoyl-CoA hydratase/phosphate acetyltransferase [Gammaproteobacteria bacterium]HIM97926.1 bifunctional enoyl-CoA hydratase/phosphate acetyltransferase [Gammaproteobacteria bacterium]HIO17051.1 bifunctional enoyl-CoA hydratase/phosphate acetyltransferase [Gammaproteobacteria bacterium]